MQINSGDKIKYTFELIIKRRIFGLGLKTRCNFFRELHARADSSNKPVSFR